MEKTDVAVVWITYAWADNRDRNVDFVAQELKDAGIEVKLDRWNLTAGKRLWEQIANFITDPAESDAWLLYATQNSLASEACREELAYALDRALNTRGTDFPIIALFPSAVDHSLIPPSIRVRLFISLADPDWKERTIGAVKRRAISISSDPLQPFVARSLSPAPPPFKYVFEFRPRAGLWNPCMVVVPIHERDAVRMTVRTGPRGRIPPIAGVVMSRGEGTTDDGGWHFSLGHEPATPTHSYYAFLREMPSSGAVH
jgi:TIR domain